MHNEDEEKITLDRETFKTLSSGTRIDIIKSLGVRRKTLSELSKQFGMSVSTVKQHLDNLAGAGLIEQMDDGHKWKYYELTRKGRGVLNPEDRKVWILLSLSVVAVLLTVADAFTGFFAVLLSSRRPFEVLAGVAESIGKDAAPLTGNGDAGGITGAVAAHGALPWIHIVLIIAFSVLAGFFATRALKKRRQL